MEFVIYLYRYITSIEQMVMVIMFFIYIFMLRQTLIHRHYRKL